MEIQQVPAASLAAMVVSLLIAVGVPVALGVLAIRRGKARLSSILTGAATFIVAAMLLEQLLHMLVLGFLAPNLSQYLPLYALYGGLAAAVFEEGGRYIAMKHAMKRTLDGPNAFAYGVGHGGAEAILLVGSTMISNLQVSLMINGGTLESTLSSSGADDAAIQATIQSLSALWTAPSAQFLLGGIERIPAVALQIALSMLVYKAVKLGKRQLFLLAMAFHLTVNFITVLLAGVLPLALVEVIIYAMVALCCYLVYRIYKQNPVQK